MRKERKKGVREMAGKDKGEGDEEDRGDRRREEINAKREVKDKRGEETEVKR